MRKRILTVGALVVLAGAAFCLVATRTRQQRASGSERRPSDAVRTVRAPPPLSALPDGAAALSPPATPRAPDSAATVTASEALNAPTSSRIPRPPPSAPVIPFPFHFNPLEISPAVRTIIGMDADREDVKARRSAINRLTVNLPVDDVAALADFLRKPHGDESGVSLNIYNTLRNDVLEVLVRQEQVPDGLGGLMVAMLRNPDEDEVWRDYSLQYMAEYYQRRWSPGSESVADRERDLMLDAYREALGRKDAPTLAGTALIGFETLSRQYAEAPRAEVAVRALDLAVDEESSVAARITALRVCSALGERQVLPAARMLAQTGAIVPLRMAAIATLGDLGAAEEDIGLLKALRGDSDPGVARIAGVALARLQTLPASAGIPGEAP